jgi:tetratricopeptide (TPR) repeat protein
MYRFPSTLVLLLLSACHEIPTAEESFLRGNLLLDSGDPRGAIDEYTAALELNPRLAQAYNNRGLSHAALREYDAAVADYDACLALPNPLSEAFYNRGVARFRLGRKGDAVIDFTEALRLNPQYVRALAGRGLVFAAGGARDPALADFRKALELAPRDWPDRKSIEAEVARLSVSNAEPNSAPKK